ATARQDAARTAHAESEAIMKRLFGDRMPPQIRAPVLPVWLRDA
ncbi:MAG: hypothetical protein QOD56_1669, partial [Gammaproteobacteria bacterium]|nr:hypothetical protein [Gammaproteobacteria bacterium]